MSTSTLAILLAVLLLVALVVGPLLTGIAHRLDRLHLRTEAAWAGLDAALGRRAAIARSVAATGAAGDSLAPAADRAELAPRVDREQAENELTRLLSEVDRSVLPAGLAAELADAEHRVVLARRVHNDAVRDTLALRRWRTVRWLKLAGTAKLPVYFEMLEPVTDMTAPPRKRPSARVVLTDAAGRVLLFRVREEAEPFWLTPGGGIEPGEDLRTAAVRELAEETGIVVEAAELTGPVWLRRVLVSLDRAVVEAEEWYFLLRTSRTDIDTSGFTQLEIDTVDGHRWWSLSELSSTSARVYPEQLAELLPELLETGWTGQTRAVT